MQKRFPGAVEQIMSSGPTHSLQPYKQGAPKPQKVMVLAQQPACSQVMQGLGMTSRQWHWLALDAWGGPSAHNNKEKPVHAAAQVQHQCSTSMLRQWPTSTRWHLIMSLGLRRLGSISACAAATLAYVNEALPCGQIV